MKFLQFFLTFFTLSGLLFSGALFAEDLIHVVGKGDTIYSISRIFQVTPDELMRVNGIADPSKLSVGKRLVIPVSSEVPARLTSSVNAPAAQVTLVNYKAVKGDTLYSIARKYNISVQRLQEINNFSSNQVLKIGDIVKVPGKSTQGNTTSASADVASAVKPLGTLYSLRWPVTPREISYMSGQMGVVVEGQRLEAVKSLTQGNVVSAGPWRKFGRVVIVETSGGYYYMYGGCETITVNVGDRIAPGMELGRLGVNSVSEKPQLFFMVFRNDTPIDPSLAPRAGNLGT